MLAPYRGRVSLGHLSFHEGSLLYFHGNNCTNLTCARQLSDKLAGPLRNQVALRGSNIVILHDNEPRDVHREVDRGATELATVARSAGSERGRQVRRASLPCSKAVTASLRAAEQGQQGDRARSHFKLSDRAKSGIQGRLSSLGALAADSRVKTCKQRISTDPAVCRTAFKGAIHFRR